jgi:ribosomal protein L11 methyltransferase
MQSSRPWNQLHLVLSAAEAEAVEAALFEAGAQSVAVQDEALEAWGEPVPAASPSRAVRLAALFRADRSPTVILEELGTAVPARILETAVWEGLADRDWSRAWMEHWKPQRFGRRLWVCPSWETPPERDAVNLRLDPGSAFGTGSHATTALCLEWLEGRDLAGQSLLDFGCGSGILAIAALRLGAHEAWACDLDRQVLPVAAENARRNDVASRLWIGHPAELPDLQADVIVANILSGTLVQLAPEFLRLHRPGGLLVLSGILENQASELQEAYGPHYALRVVARRAGWVLMEGKNGTGRLTRSAGTRRGRAAPP